MKNIHRFLAGTMLLATACGTGIGAGQRGIKVNAFGGMEQHSYGAGFHFQWPWNDLVVYDVTWQTRTEDIAVLTADDLHVTTKVSVTFRPALDELPRLHAEVGRSYYERLIQPAFATITRSEFAEHDHGKLPEESPKIEEEILGKIRTTLAKMPLEIERVSIIHIDFDSSVTQAIARKLNAAQELAQKDSELGIAKKDAEILRARVAAEIEAEQLRTEAKARALVTDGEARAQAQAAITRTLTPAYLRYLWVQNQGTKWVFSPLGADGMPIILGGTK